MFHNKVDANSYPWKIINYDNPNKQLYNVDRQGIIN